MPEPLKLASSRATSAAADAIELLGQSPAITRVRELVRRAAALDSGVLVTAEAGCAVESVARELHARGRLAAGPFIAIACAAADPGRLERLLFGGPPPDLFSDLESVTADSRIAAARGGVLFLQDVADLPAGVQARVARVARDGEVRIDGRPVETGFRLVASASGGIDADVDGHRFRPDLYRRLAAIRIDLPPLRDRFEDVPVLAARLVEELCAAHDLPTRAFTQAALALVGALRWSGNVAELREALERVLTDSRDATIQVEHLLPTLRLPRGAEPFTPAGTLREARMRFERDYIASVLQHHDWHMANAAQTLGIQRPNLYRKARQLGIPLVRAVEERASESES